MQVSGLLLRWGCCSPQKVVDPKQKKPQVHELLEAVKNKNINQIKQLINKRADVNATNKYGETALHGAAFYGSEDIVQALVIAGTDVNVTNKYGRTALQMAKRYGRYDNVNKAIKEGKQKLISLYENQQCQLKTGVNSPIHECESLREPLLQNKPEKLNETQIQQAIKYRKEKKIRNYKFFNKNNFSSIKFFKINP